MPAPIPIVTADPLQKLEGFIQLMSQSSERLVDRQNQLGDLGAQMDGKAEQDGEPLVQAQEHLTSEREELLAAGRDTTEALERLADSAELVGGQQVGAVTEQVVELDAAVESETSAAANELQADAATLREEGYDAFRTVSDAAEQSLEEARAAFEAVLQSVVEGLETATSLVETASAGAATRIDEQGQQVTHDAHEFTAAAVDATQAWSSELPSLVADAIAEHVKAVNELYHAWDETEIEGFDEFQKAYETKVEEAGETLESAASALSGSTEEARSALEAQQEQAKETADVAEKGAEAVSGLGGGSLIDTIGNALDVVDTVADALANL